MRGLRRHEIGFQRFVMAHHHLFGRRALWSSAKSADLPAVDCKVLTKRIAA